MAMNGIEQDAIIERLDNIIRRSAPEAVSQSKYGGTLYTLKPDEKEGHFCGVFPYTNHVQLAFSNGTALKDTKQVLTGTGKFRRHINFAAPREIEPEILAELLGNAVAISLSQGAG